MYNEKLEQLIDAALTDGELTEKEKQILFKKAMVMGIDLDEFEMVLDSRLAKLQQEKKAKEQEAAPKSNKFGDVKKCPACGAIVQSYQGVCLECGYAFENIEANRLSKKLDESIQAILNEYKISGNNKTDIKSLIHSIMDKRAEEMDERIRQIISNFPIPNTKSDLMEFILSLESKIQVSDYYTDAYWVKYQECLAKASFLFPNDKEMLRLLSNSKKTKPAATRAREKRNIRAFALLFLLLFLMMIIISIIS